MSCLTGRYVSPPTLVSYTSKCDALPSSVMPSQMGNFDGEYNPAVNMMPCIGSDTLLKYTMSCRRILCPIRGWNVPPGVASYRKIWCPTIQYDDISNNVISYLILLWPPTVNPTGEIGPPTANRMLYKKRWCRSGTSDTTLDVVPDQTWAISELIYSNDDVRLF